ncbi:GAF domain-containing protein [Kitasatospora sp. NPDC094028]
MSGNTENPTGDWTTALRYIAGRKTAEESLGFLAHVSATVRNTPELLDVVPAAAKACVPFFATAVLLEAPAVHADPVVHGPEESRPALRELLGAAAGTEPRLVVSGHEGLAAQSDPQLRARLGEWGVDSAAVLRLEFRGVPGGRLVAVRGATHRRGPFSPGDLALLGEVADRIAAFNAFAAHLTGRAGR